MPPFEVNVTPRKPLSKEWHKLFETCNEITSQADIVRIVAACLTADQLRQASNNIAGRLFVYHFRSFTIHVKTLGEWANKLIKKTVETYINDHKPRKKLYQRYRRVINKEMPEHLGRIRNSNVHATDDNWSRGVTTEQNWEPAVALGQTPRIAYDVLFYPLQGSKFKGGEYTHFVDAAEIILNDIGNILYALEQDLKAKYNLKCTPSAKSPPSPDRRHQRHGVPCDLRPAASPGTTIWLP